MCSMVSTRAANARGIFARQNRQTRLDDHRPAVELGRDEMHARTMLALPASNAR
jgi:hypothetical protein